MIRWFIRRVVDRLRPSDAAIQEEMETHVLMRAEYNHDAGMSPEDADAAARQLFGNRRRIQEDIREVYWRTHAEGLLRDATLAVRRLTRRPATSAAAVLTVALAIGAATAVLILVDGVLWRPLPVDDLSRLVLVEQVLERDGVENRRSGVWSDSYRRLDEASLESFAGLAAISDARDRRTSRLITSLSGDTSSTEYLRGAFVSSNYFSLLGIDLTLGRNFTPVDDSLSAVPTTVLSHRLWASRFGSDPSVLGRTVRVEQAILRIVGVAPEAFAGTDWGASPPDLFFPLMTARSVLGTTGTQTDGAGAFFFGDSPPEERLSPISPIAMLNVIGRLEAGVFVESAEAELIARVGDAETDLQLTPLTEAVLPFAARMDIRTFLVLLGAAVGMTLLVGCANLAGLLLARIEERRVDLAVRRALGAGHGRLIRELVVESTILAASGGLIGTVLTIWIGRGLTLFALPGGIPVSILDMRLDARGLGFAAVATVLAAVIVGVAPAWRGARTDFSNGLDHKAVSPRMGPTLTLVGAQVGLSLVLVFGAVAFGRSVAEALAVDLGFEPEGRISITVSPPPLNAFPEAIRLLETMDDFTERMRTVPGVSGASIGSMPLVAPTDGSEREIAVDGVRVGPVERVLVDSEYFRVLGQPVLRGRAFTAGDIAGAPPVVVINESAARAFWPDRDAVNRQLMVRDELATVVGIVSDVRLESIREAGPPMLYQPRSQNEPFVVGAMTGRGSAQMIVWAANPVEPAFEAIRGVAAEVGLPLAAVGTVDDELGAILMPQRLGRALLAGLGAIAVMLASVGIYGMTSCVVARSEKEIGVRRALGASAPDSARVVLRTAFYPIIGGLAGGSLLAWWGGGFADRFMYGIRGADALTLVLAVLMLLAAGVLAIVPPARRALRIDPADVLRAD